MSQLKWKVCGLRDNIEDVVALQPDYLGFIFYSKSPRYVGKGFLMPEIGVKSIQKVGVFVNEAIDFVLKTMQKYRLDFAQIHGHESPDYCNGLKQKGIKVIKAFQIDALFDFELLKEYDSADYFLFDTKTSQYGGSGKAFDWSVLKKYSMEKEYFLSGGIGLDNLSELKKLDLSKIHALDVNSKFEIRPGFKDVEMLRKLRDKFQNTNSNKQINLKL